MRYFTGDMMPIEEKIISFLKTYTKKTIPLSMLEQQIKGNTDYKSFATAIQNLTNNGILLPVKSHGANGKPQLLFNTYRIKKADLRDSLNKEIQKYSIEVNPEISLENYFLLDENEWYKDLPYILKIDSNLNKLGLPLNQLTLSELSYLLVGDEKWLSEGNGKKVLERVKLWDKLNLLTKPDPLMLGINPYAFTGPKHMHLIVENKATYYALFASLKETEFTSLIYGAGWKIAANINILPVQIGLEMDPHELYYFGDIDPEGISIWYTLYENYKINLALPFYKALLKKDYSHGKETQQKNWEAITKFLAYFSPEEKDVISDLIYNRGYLPQEALSKTELLDIWRKSSWISP